MASAKIDRSGFPAGTLIPAIQKMQDQQFCGTENFDVRSPIYILKQLTVRVRAGELETIIKCGVGFNIFLQVVFVCFAEFFFEFSFLLNKQQTTV